MCDIIIVQVVSRIGHQIREVLKRSWHKALRGMALKCLHGIHHNGRKLFSTDYF